MTPAQVRDDLAAFTSDLPEAIRERLLVVPIEIVNYPPDAHLQMGVELGWRGAFLKAESFDEESDPSPGLIALYLSNIKPLDSEHVRLTYMHEAGHALGMDEDEVKALGL